MNTDQFILPSSSAFIRFIRVLRGKSFSYGRAGV